MPKTPEAYLDATRRLRDDFIPRQYYAELYERICSGIKAFGEAPDFHVTYSTSRICETLDVGGGTTIIYDVYLGQTFNQLNRLHFNSNDREEMVGYACKVLAEELQLAGRLEEALGMALSYRRIQERSAKTYRNDRALRKRTMTTLIQEAYVIAHEGMHHVLANDPAWRSRAISDARIDFLANHLLPSLEQIDPSESKSYAESLKRQVEAFATDDALVEECVCDTLAVPLIWLMFAQECDTPTIRSAIFFALRHLRLLTILKTYARWIERGADRPEDTIDPYIVRTGFLQFVIKQFEGFASEISSDINDQAFMAEQERYETFVGDPVIEEVFIRLPRLREVSSAAPHKTSPGDLNALIDDAVGYSSQAVQVMRNLGEAHFRIGLGSLDDDGLARLKKNITKRFRRGVTKARKKRSSSSTARR